MNELKLIELIEKNEQKKIQFLYYLDQKPNQKIKNSDIQDKLQISYYLFKNLTKEIAQDLDRFELSDFFNIEVTETDTTLFENHNTNTSVFMEHYLKNSYQVKILMKVMIEHHSFNLEDFAEDNFVSKAFMYKRFVMLRKTLKSWGITLNNNGELTGDELAIRLLLSNLAIITNLEESVYDVKVQNTVHDLFTLPNAPDIAFSMSQLIETKSYFLVSVHRFKQGYRIGSTKEIAYLIKNIRQRSVEIRQTAKDVFNRYFGSTNEETDSECDYLVTFMAVMGTIQADDIEFPETIRQKGENFIDGFQDRFSIQLSDFERENVAYEVNKTFVDVTMLPFRSQFFDEHIEVGYFFRTYPEFFDYCQEFVLNETDLKLDSTKAQFMFYHCLLTVAANVPLSRVIEPLHICVDFTLGKEYNRIIERDIKYFSTLNLKVDDKVHPKTKLIITDLVNAYRDFDVSKVIWLSPPRAEDWENLINVLLELRKEHSE